MEVIKRNFSPSTIRRRKAAAVANEHSKSENHGGGVHSICPSHLDSDEDATLNEMMGKFDESYVYEKETDILRYNYFCSITIGKFFGEIFTIKG